MAINLSPRVVKELNVLLVSMFDQGAHDAAKKMSPVLETAYFSTSDTTENVYTFAQADFELRDRGDSAETIVDGVKFYESRVKDGKKYKIIEVDLDAFEDDKVGQYATVFYRLGTTQALGPSRLLEDTILNAESLTCYDGKALVATNHEVKPFEGGTAWANKLVKSAGLTFATFQDGWAAMQQFPDENGRPAGRTPTILMVDPSNRQIAWDICYSDRPLNQSGGGNPWKGEVRPMIVPFFGIQDPGTWYLIDDSSARERPFIFQERKALRLIPLFSSHDDWHVLKSRKLSWMVDGRIGAGAGYPSTILKVTKT
ncbi:MAG: Mu-like prophage major head subunit gpT family protein [Minicystis sp.]